MKQKPITKKELENKTLNVASKLGPLAESFGLHKTGPTYHVTLNEEVIYSSANKQEVYTFLHGMDILCMKIV